MDAVLTLLGIAIVVVGLRDMFHMLLHPRGQGGLSTLVLRGAWALSKATGHQVGSGVGPAAMVAAIALWVVLQTVGWALIYYPHVSGGFAYSSGVDPDDYLRAAEALYISLMTLTTLGYGDVVATDPWLRLAAPLQALTGFALLTAALTWFTQVYPPLARRRALAVQVTALEEADYAEAVGELEPDVLAHQLDALASDLGRMRVDYAQHTEGFYFREPNLDLSSPHRLPYLLRVRDAARDRREATVRVSCRQFDTALEQLAAQIRDDFVKSGQTPDEVFAAFAAEHHGSTES